MLLSFCDHLIHLHCLILDANTQSVVKEAFFDDKSDHKSAKSHAAISVTQPFPVQFPVEIPK